MTIFNSDLADYLNSVLLGKKLGVKKVSSFPNKEKHSLSFLSSKASNNVSIEKNTTVITNKINYNKLKAYNVSVIISENPKFDFAKITQKFFKKKKLGKLSVKKQKSSVFGKNFTAEKGVIIEDNVKIGDNVYIGMNSIIKSNVIIKDNVEIQSGSIIGVEAFSFGYNKNSQEKYIKVPSYGGVIIENNVNIGNNCIIQKGLFENTYIGEYTKVNDLSNIGNSVKIGTNSLIMANVYLSGRVEIGKNVWVAPNVSIIQGIKIGDNSQIGIGSVVTKNIKSKSVAYGNPARLVRKRVI